MVGLDLLLIKIAAKCNLNCSYCYIYNSGYKNSLANQPKHITDETLDNLADKLGKLDKAQHKNMVICLHGGEPLLVGNKRLKTIVQRLSEHFPGALTIQSNGTLINQETLDILHEYNCSIGISLDGPIEVNDKYRVYRTNKGSYYKTVKALELIQSHPIAQENFSTIIGVIDPDTDPIACYQELSKYKPKSIDFLFKDGYYHNLPVGKKTLTDTNYGDWLLKLIDYYTELSNPIPIRKIDNLIKDIINTQLGKSNMQAFAMVTVNPNGELTKNELYDICPAGTKFTSAWNINQHCLNDLLLSEEFKHYTYDGIAQNQQCLSCDHYKYCLGGPEVHARWNNDNGFNNPSIYCSDYKKIFAKLYPKVEKYLLSKQGAAVNI